MCGASNSNGIARVSHGQCLFLPAKPSLFRPFLLTSRLDKVNDEGGKTRAKLFSRALSFIPCSCSSSSFREGSFSHERSTFVLPSSSPTSPSIHAPPSGQASLSCSLPLWGVQIWHPSQLVPTRTTTWQIVNELRVKSVRIPFPKGNKRDKRIGGLLIQLFHLNPFG